MRPSVGPIPTTRKPPPPPPPPPFIHTPAHTHIYAPVLLLIIHPSPAVGAPPVLVAPARALLLRLHLGLELAVVDCFFGGGGICLMAWSINFCHSCCFFCGGVMITLGYRMTMEKTKKCAKTDGPLGDAGEEDDALHAAVHEEVVERPPVV